MDMRRFAGRVLFYEVSSAEGGVGSHEQVEESAREEYILAHVAGSRDVKISQYTRSANCSRLRRKV